MRNAEVRRSLSSILNRQPVLSGTEGKIQSNETPDFAQRQTRRPFKSADSIRQSKAKNSDQAPTVSDNECTMLRRLLTALPIAALLLVTYLAAAPQPTSANELLHVASNVTYEVLPDDGPVHVIWQVALQNDDPATTPGRAGAALYYESLTIPILRGATNVVAAGPTGSPLNVEIDIQGEGPIDVATVAFDQQLFFGDAYDFQLSYDIVEARSTALLATDSYVFLPAIVSGDSAEVRIVTPDDGNWEVTVEPLDCAPAAGGLFSCGPSEFVQVAAFVEVARAGVLTSSSFSVSLQATEISVTVRHFAGEEAWAGRMQDLAVAALSVLEELFGVPYQGPAELEIAGRGRQDISGYEGTFGCIFDSCLIGVSPPADNSVALHELAHPWTPRCGGRWIAEGLADFMSERAAGTLLAPFDSLAPQNMVELQLDEWGRSRYLIGATDADLAIEATGYYKSRTFFERLEETAGLSTLQGAHAAAMELGGGIDSEQYLDLLEEASGMRLDSLFLDEVFPDSYGSRLAQRRDLRERLDTLRPATRDAGFNLPARIGQLLDEWEFDEAEGLLVAAERALAAYQDALVRVREPRDIWTRIGLIGKDPDAGLGASADAFAATEFSRSERLSQAAISELDGASDAALMRVVIGVGVIVVALLIVAGVVWVARSRTIYR